MPLLDQEFQRGKCGLKLLQYMAAGIPTVASPVGVNKEITRHGETGYLAMTAREWEESLAALIQSSSLRASMGSKGRCVCDAQWSIKRWLPELEKIFRRVGHVGT
jgi:glycosyltransferase involved in cell wall biosynthesis